MIRTVLLTVFVSTSLTNAFARQSANLQAAPPARNAGVFHVATGTWTRASTQAQATLGPDVLYDNSCTTGFFTALEGRTVVDEGRLPSPSSTMPSGCSTHYRVDGFEFGYCTDQTASTFGTYTHRFFQEYSPCTPILGREPTATVVLSNLPASAVNGVISCWTVTIDLSGTGGGSFVLAADGDGMAGSPALDRFGWASSTTAAGNQTGPTTAGNPSSCPVGAGTFYSALQVPGTGLGNLDQFYLDANATGGITGCFWYSGNPFAGFHLKLLGTACESFPMQTTYCVGDGSGTACPCGNESPAGADAGCRNTTNEGGKLRGFGTPSLSADTFVLLGSDMTNGPCLYYQGTVRENAGNGTVFGDGLLCVGGTVVRMGTKQNGAGASQYPSPGDASISTQGSVGAVGTRTYQGWYRNIAPFCSPAGFNLTNGLEVTWGA